MKIFAGLAIGMVLIFSNFVYAADSYEAKRYAALIFAQNYQQELIAQGYKAEENSLKEESIGYSEKGIGRLELGPEIYHFRYEEPDVMEEKGMMYGLTGAYSWHKNFMLKAEGRLSGGQVNYESEDTGTIDNITDFSAEVRGLGGYDFKPTQDFVITPYFGIGYRYLNDDMYNKISSSGAIGYERESNYIYSPLGVEGIFKMQDSWSIGGLVEYDIFWQGKQKNRFVSGTYYDNIYGYYVIPENIDNIQNKGYGIRGTVKLQKKGENFDFMIEPFIRYWNIKESKKSNYTTISSNNDIISFIEPKNNSTEIGVKVAVGF